MKSAADGTERATAGMPPLSAYRVMRGQRRKETRKETMNRTRRSLLGVAAALVGGTAVRTGEALAASAREIERDADRALRTLYAIHPKARELGNRSKAILVFPKIVKAGLLIGGLGGDGALREHGTTVGYYNIAAASFGLQAGAQTYSYALFFMNDGALDYIKKSDGWSIGSGPSVVVVDKGAAASLTSTTLSQDVYAFPFGQHGLMAGIGLEGSKITPIHPT
jgi:lipid-binding SYLF domain-containing protein